MEALKQKIKQLALEQKHLKDQRKTVHFSTPRCMDSWNATIKHLVNRENLRIMYAAYGKLKGKTYSQIENKYPEENHPLNKYEKEIQKLISVYEEAVCVDK